MSNPTQQEIFDMMVDGLRKQGRKCINTHGCVYRAVKENGDVDKCAVGFLITDQVYADENVYEDDGSYAYNHLEDNNIEAAEVMDAVEKSLEISDPDWWELDRETGMHSLMLGMQTIHDSHEQHQWEILWEKLADDFGLQFTPRVTG